MKSKLLVYSAILVVAASNTGLRAASTESTDQSSERVAKVSLNDVTIVAEQKGWLKEEFDKIGARAELVPCAVGVVPPLLERGDVNIANSMHGFSYVQLLDGFDPAIVWQSGDVDPRTVVITVLADSPIKTLADLQGKTLGVAQWTCGYYGACEALKNAGVPLDTRLAPGKVRYVNLTGGQTVTTALLAGKVDAVATHPSGLESLYLQGIIRDIGTAVPGGKFVHSDRIVYYCKRSWARDNPDLIKAFLVVQNRALVFIHEHTEEAAAIVSKALRKPEEIVLAEFREPGNQRLFLPEKEYSNAVAAFETFQTLALANADGLVTESRKGFSDQQVHELFDSRFFKGGAYYPGDYDSGRLVSVTTASGVGQSLAQASSGFVK